VFGGGLLCPEAEVGYMGGTDGIEGEGGEAAGLDGSIVFG